MRLEKVPGMGFWIFIVGFREENMELNQESRNDTNNQIEVKKYYSDLLIFTIILEKDF